MNDATLRPAAPAFAERAGRTWLSYSEMEDPRLVHGVIVFKQTALGSDHLEWLGLVARELETGLPVRPGRIAIPRQVHSARVVDVDRTSVGEIGGDGVVTATPLTAIGVSVSDCIPLFAADTEAGVIGLAHCGWRGIAAGVVEEFLKVLDCKGADLRRTVFLVGAAIGPCCYEVGSDLLSHFEPAEARAYSHAAGRGVFFDLKSVVASRLIAAGAGRGEISIDNTCTSCQKYLLSSYRADGRDCGRMLAFLMLTA